MKILKIFDAHFHIIEPGYSLIANQGFKPDYFTISDYREIMSDYEIIGGVVVSGSFQGHDQTFLTSALNKLGTGFIGIIQLPFTTGDNKIIELDKAGIRGVRIILKRDEYKNIEQLNIFAKRVYELAGWHIELYVDSAKLGELETVLLKLPKICIDHLGLSITGQKYLLKLVDKGAHVKASGFGRVNFDVCTILKTLYSCNPAAMMFGTDLPSTRAPRPFRFEDCKLILDCLGESAADRVFYKNALDFYNINGKAGYS